MGFAVRVRSAGQKYGPTCHQRDRADVTEFVTLLRLSSLGQHVGVLALAGYKRRKSALTAGPIGTGRWGRMGTDSVLMWIDGTWMTVNTGGLDGQWYRTRRLRLAVYTKHSTRPSSAARSRSFYDVQYGSLCIVSRSVYRLVFVMETVGHHMFL